MDISAIRNISTEGARRHVPPLTDYNSYSTDWNEVEYGIRGCEPACSGWVLVRGTW